MAICRSTLLPFSGARLYSLRKRMPLGQLMHIPRRQPMPNRLLADLFFRHRRDDLVVDQQAIHVQSLVARRVGHFELDRAAPFRVLHTGKQGGLEQFRLVFEFLHVRLMSTAGWMPRDCTWVL